MSISFSGLASGLDTSSWVESLTALKKAKVSSLTEEQEAVQTAKEALSNIRSFFSSFRSLLEKVTDTKFNVVNTDLFAQKLATSSNAAIVSALAKAEAEEGKYDIKVDKLAGNTKATSKYGYTTTVITTTTASYDSLLKDIGIKAGDIGVTVNGVEQIISLTDTDTLGSLANKLKKIGVNANFNEKTGIFTMNVDSESIRDIGNTGIIDGLHLTNVNRGYSSNVLEKEQVNTTNKQADGSTKLSDLGVKPGTITISTSDAEYDITIDEGDTLQDFLDALTSNGINAKLTDGTFTLEDAEITSDGTTGLMDAFGLSSEVTSNIQKSGNLSYETIVTTTTKATSGTLLKDLEGGENLQDGDTVVIKKDSGEFATITLDSTSTIQDLVDKLKDAGLNASMSNGRLTLSGGEITGGSFDVVDILGLAKTSSGSVSYTMTGSNKLTAGGTYTANGSTSFKDLGFTSTDDISLDLSDGSKITMGVNDTINDLIDKLGDAGINTSITDGILSFDNTNGVYISGGNLADKLGIGTATTTTTVSTSQTSTAAITATTTAAADRDTKLVDLGIAEGYARVNVAGNGLSYSPGMDITSTTTIGDLLDFINSTCNTNPTGTGFGLTASISDGVISIDSTKGYYIYGDVLTALGITAEQHNGETVTIGGTTTKGPYNYTEATTIITTTTVTTTHTETIIGTETIVGGETVTITTGASWTSTAPATYTVSEDVTENTKLSDINGKAYNTITIFPTGSSAETITLSGDATISDLFSALGNYGINGSISNSRLTFTLVDDSNGNEVFATGDLLNDLGIGTTRTTYTTIIDNTTEEVTTVTVGATWSSTAQVTYTTAETYATSATELGDIADHYGNGTANNYRITIKDSQTGDGVATITMSATDTINDLFGHLQDYGFSTDMTNWTGSISLSSDDYYVEGDIITQMGIETTTDTKTINVTGTKTITVGSSLSSSSAITYEESGVADENTRLGDIVNVSDWTVNCDDPQYNGSLFDLTADTTLGEFMAKLKSEWGFESTLTDGVLSIKDPNGKMTLDGELIDALGITVSSTTVAATIKSTASVVQTQVSELVRAAVSGSPLSATYDTTLEELGFTGYGTIVLNTGIIGDSDSDGTADDYEFSTIIVHGSMTLRALVNTLNGFDGPDTIDQEPFEDPTYADTANANMGISLSADGTLEISEGYVGTCWIHSIDSDLANALGFSGYTFTKLEVMASGDMYGTYAISETTYLQDLFGEDISGDGPALYVDINNNGSTNTIYYTDKTTVGEFLQMLRDNGIDAELSSDGILTLTPQEGNSITGDGFGIFEKFNIADYNPSAETKYEMSDSNKLEYTKTVTADANTTFGELGLGGNTPGVTLQDGSFFAVNSSATIGSFLEELNSYGFTTDITDGVVTITGGDDVYIKTYAKQLFDLLNINADSTYTERVEDTSDTTTVTVTKNTDAQVFENVTNVMDENTTFGDLSLGTSVTQTIVSNGTTITTAVTGSTTVGQFINWLNDNGFEASVSDGRFTISGGDNIYTNNLNDTLDKLLNFADHRGSGSGSHNGRGSSYNVETRTTSAGSTSTITVTATINTTTSSASASKAYTVTEDTTFGQLGIDSWEVVTINVNGTEKTMTIETSTTVGDFRDWLNDNGFTASISSDGKFTISGADGVYISDLNDAVEKALGMSDVYGEGNSFTTRTVTNDKTETITTTNTVVTTTTATQTNTSTVSTTKTADRDTTIGKISSNPWVYTISSNGTTYTTTFSTTSTLGDVLDWFENKGFTVDLTDGTMTITGSQNIFIVGDSSNTTTTLSGYTNPSSSRFTEQRTTTINGDTTFSEIQGLGINETLQIDITEDGFTYGIGRITGATTLDEFFNMISACGLSGSVKDGVVTITGNGDVKLASYMKNTLSGLLLGDTVSTTQNITSNTNSNQIIGNTEVTAGASSKLGDIILADGTNPTSFDLTVNGKEYNFTSDNTVQDVINSLKSDGYTLSVSSTGEVSIISSTSPVISGSLSEVLFGTNPTTTSATTGATSYTSEDLEVSGIQTIGGSLTKDTLLSSLGVTGGEFTICNNGVKYKAMISSTDTVNDFIETLKQFGLQAAIIKNADGSFLKIIGNGDSYIESSNSSTASNIVDVLFPDGKQSSFNYASNLGISETTTAIVKATESTLLSDYDSKWGDGTLKSEGTLSVTVDGENSIIRIGAGETFGSLMEKFEALGIEASLIDGKLLLQGGNHEFLINSAASSSNLLSNLGLTYSDNLGGYAASAEEVKETIESIVQKDGSVASNADMNTKLSLVNISSGTLALYRDGAKATIQINEDETFADLRSRISAAFSDVDISLDDGYLRIFSKTDGVSITAGSNIDTSNIASVLGLSTSGNEVVSARELYKVNGTSVLTDSGLFKRGDVTEGTFVIGNATFTIDDKTTLNDLISQINSSEEANATAFWDPIDGKLVINSRTSGAAFINIEKGTSNFTDIMGFTTTADDGTERLDTSSQELGSNAKFSINGTNFTSSSNTITSDISRIKGVTLDLKDVSNGEIVTITIEKNSEKVTDAMEDIVNAYNSLIENVDKEIASTGNLSDQSTLKIIRNQLRSLMTSSGYGNSVFKNLDAVGIALDAASANDVSTNNINKLHFDRDKFIEAYNKDSDALKSFLVGTEDSLGVLSRVENLVESSLKSVTGYFDSAENSYSNQIKKYSDKIKKANSAVDSYKSRLEAKFKSMDMIISNIKNQYNSFLTNS